MLRSVIILACVGLLSFIPVRAYGAALFLNPPAGTFLVGSTFDLSIVLDTKGAAVNTVEIELLFPPDKIQLANPSVGQSIIQLWPAPPVFSNKDGKIYFIGGIPSPGVVTSQGVLLTLTFRVVGPGQAEIRFGDRSSILANDGAGTDILGQHPTSFYSLEIPPPQGPAITSPTHPDQERWYKDPNPLFVWSKSKFATAYSYSLDRDPSGAPDTVSEGNETTTSFSDVENGIWYFHLRERAGEVWGGVSHYVVKIDHGQPAAFRLNVSPSLRTTESRPIFRFFTTDALSGLSHFELKMVPLASDQALEALFFEVTSPYQAVNLEPGRYQVILRALDGAGNVRDETATLDIVGSFERFLGSSGEPDLGFVVLSWATVVLVATLALLIILALLFILWRRHKYHLERARLLTVNSNR